MSTQKLRVNVTGFERICAEVMKVRAISDPYLINLPHWVRMGLNPIRMSEMPRDREGLVTTQEYTGEMIKSKDYLGEFLLTAAEGTNPAHSLTPHPGFQNGSWFFLLSGLGPFCVTAILENWR